MHKTAVFKPLRHATLLKKRLWHRCFLVDFVKFLRTRFLQNTSATASILREGRRLKQIEISIISKLRKKKIKKEKCSYIFYFLLVALILFLFGLHFLQRRLIFHYIHTLIMFKHAEFGKHTWIDTSKLKKHAHFKISSRYEVFTGLFFFFSSLSFIPGRVSSRDEISRVNTH